MTEQDRTCNQRSVMRVPSRQSRVSVLYAKEVTDLPFQLLIVCTFCLFSLKDENCQMRVDGNKLPDVCFVLFCFCFVFPFDMVYDHRHQPALTRSTVVEIISCCPTQKTTLEGGAIASDPRFYQFYILDRAVKTGRNGKAVT